MMMEAFILNCSGIGCIGSTVKFHSIHANSILKINFWDLRFRWSLLEIKLDQVTQVAFTSVFLVRKVTFTVDRNLRSSCIPGFRGRFIYNHRPFLIFTKKIEPTIYVFMSADSILA